MGAAPTVERIRVPEEFDGPWDHALILTFNAGLAFYERALARKLGHVPHKVILADQVMLAETFAVAAHTQELRQVNGGYLASPIRSRGAAHAKIVLLTSRQHGRLLVGSGNLSQHGYASQGELFCRYTHNPKHHGDDAAFLAVRDLVQGLVTREWVDDIVADHVNAIWSTTPWLYAIAEDEAAAVRHNLEVPLLDQFVEAIAGRTVRELTVHAPFWDPDAAALQRLLQLVQPLRLTVLVQDRYTQAPADKLQGVLEKADTPHVIRLVEPQERSYLHAKFLLANLGRITVCMQGSANLSRAALTLTADAGGNIEAVNLIERPSKGLLHIVGSLTVSKPKALEEVDLAEPEPAEKAAIAGPRILRADWDGTSLRLLVSEPLPAEATAELVLAGEVVSVPLEIEGEAITCALPAAYAAVLDRAFPVTLRITVTDEQAETPAVYPYRHKALRSTLSPRTDPGRLRRAVTLEFDIDDNIERLLRELDDALVIDRRSVWRIAGTGPGESVDQEEGAVPSLGDLNWEQIQNHPRIAQYRNATKPGPDPSDLQILLGTIAARFGDLGQTPAASVPPRPAAGVDALPDEPEPQQAAEMENLTEEEIADQEAEQDARSAKIRKQARNAFGRFAKRFAAGLADAEFADLVGPATVMLNFILFNDLLVRLLAHEMLKEDKGLDLQISIWQHMFGAGEQHGYLASLTGEDADLAQKALQDHHAPASLLQAVGIAADTAWNYGTSEELLSLREVWRRMLVHPFVSFDSQALAEAASRDGPEGQYDLVDSLAWLARYFEPSEVCATVAEVLGIDPKRVRFDEGELMRGGRLESQEFLAIDTTRTPLATQEKAAAALAAWSRMEPDRAYWRINHKGSKSVAVLDRSYDELWYFDPEVEEVEDISLPLKESPAWEDAIAAIETAWSHGGTARQKSA